MTTGLMTSSGSSAVDDDASAFLAKRARFADSPTKPCTDRRMSSVSSTTTTATSDSLSPEHGSEWALPTRLALPTSLSYSVPASTSSSSSSSSNVAGSTSSTPRSRPAVDVIATYMNTSEARSKTDLLRTHSAVASPRTSSQRLRSGSSNGKEASGEWGWFADIDSSSESCGEGSLTALRRKLSADLGLLDHGSSVHVLGDEQTNTRITAAHKTFTITEDGKSRVESATFSIPKFRIVQSRAGADRHAQYLITFKLGRELYADWRRYSEFGELIKKVDVERYPRSHLAWRSIDTRWFNRLEPSYLHQKCIALENFMRELMYESNDPSLLLEFLGGYLARVNTRPSDPTTFRPSAQLPKDQRPAQPKHERELFEKMWAENFKRSCVEYSTDLTSVRQTASS